MANLLDLRNKINSTKNTGQITKALEMVSAARQKKANDFLNNSRFIRDGINQLMTEITSGNIGSLPKFFKPHDSNRVLIVTVMSQRGLCGGMNSNLFFEILKYKKHTEKEVDFISVNKIAQKYLKNFKENILAYYSNIPENPEIDNILPIIDFIKTNYEKYDSIYIAYTEFIKSGVFEPKLVKLLPFEKVNPNSQKEQSIYSVEPDAYTLLDSLSNLYIDLEVYEAILSNQASEHSARMIAMKKATDNVKDIVNNLTLTMNKERQAKITQAMAEISANI